MRWFGPLKHKMLAAAVCVLLCVEGWAYRVMHPPKYGPPCFSHPCSGENPLMPPLSPATIAKMEKSYRHWQRAELEIDNGQYQKAETDARQCLALGRDPEMAQKYLAEALDGEGKTAQALPLYAALRSHDGHDLLRYSLLLLKTGHWAQAVGVYEDALPQVRGQFDGADAALQAAYGHFSPNIPQPRALATGLHLALGMMEQGYGPTGDDRALADFRQAVSLSPHSETARLFYQHAVQEQNRVRAYRAARATAK